MTTRADHESTTHCKSTPHNQGMDPQHTGRRISRATDCCSVDELCIQYWCIRRPKFRSESFAMPRIASTALIPDPDLLHHHHYSTMNLTFRSLIVYVQSLGTIIQVVLDYLQCLGICGHSSTIVIVTDADGALTSKTLGPESVKVDVSLGHVGVGE